MTNKCKPWSLDYEPRNLEVDEEIPALPRSEIGRSFGRTIYDKN